MNLYLVQHAEAKPEQEDPERPLTEKGFTDIRKVAAIFKAYAPVSVSRILHSGKTRARQTAEALAQALKPPDGIQPVEGLAPLDDPDLWAERLAQMQEDTMLVGHLPHLSKLAGLLLCKDPSAGIVAFQMGGIVCLGRDEAGAWALRWMVVPQLLA